MSRIPFIPVSRKVQAGGRDFIVSALPCGILRREVLPLATRLEAGEMLKGDNFDQALQHIAASVSVAEPGISAQDLDNGLLVTDVAMLFKAVVEVSGLTRTEKEPPSGEALSPSSPSSSGDSSTGSSSPQQDGPSLTSSES